MPREALWTSEARATLYQCLVRHFGPLNSWEGMRPGRGLNDTYDEFLKSFAIALGAKSAEAVRQQINFTNPRQPHGNLGRQHVATMLLNLAAAYHADFIKQSGFPDFSEPSEPTPATATP